ncbi:LysM peptidoglycan-binding domain-containing protein [Sporosarcina sp. USHLN248]|uniref:LysM peptidoglycan-binding domain-containing protein n=1 Tax=Sporosarcina sp. USHLN248 TaxID=3081300 RepID=UPI0030185E81
MDVHVVVKGDTLWKIARQYGIPFEELKRVNAHLANPDYIVPGMKIFLPAQKAGQKPPVNEPAKKPGHTNPPQHKAPAQPPQHKVPTPPQHKMPTPAPPQHKAPTPAPPQHKAPKPTPPQHKAPMPAPKPQPMPRPPAPIPVPPKEEHVKPRPPAEPQVPPVKPETHRPPVAQPQPQPQPIPMPMPMPVPQIIQPIFTIPCNWMPIYDADCLPMPHHHHMWPQQMPQAQAPAPLPMPMPRPELNQEPMMPFRPSLPVQEEAEEMPIHPGMGHGAPPQYPYTQGWELAESTSHRGFEHDHMDFEDMVHCPPEHGYIPQMVAPAFQGPFGMAPHSHFDCGCQQPMMMPMHNYCPPIPCFPMFHGGGHVMPFHATPMHMAPMHMQPFPSDFQNDCGC